MNIPDLHEEVKRLRAENAAQLAELHAISEALGTSEGHSSVYWIEHLKDRLSHKSAELTGAFHQIESLREQLDNMMHLVASVERERDELKEALEEFGCTDDVSAKDYARYKELIK